MHAAHQRRRHLGQLLLLATFLDIAAQQARNGKGSQACLEHHQMFFTQLILAQHRISRRLSCRCCRCSHSRRILIALHLSSLCTALRRRRRRLCSDDGTPISCPAEPTSGLESAQLGHGLTRVKVAPQRLPFPPPPLLPKPSLEDPRFNFPLPCNYGSSRES